MIKRIHARKQWYAAVASANLAVLAWFAPAEAQLYRNSVASNDIDFIIESDPSLFEKLEFVGQQVREMADKRPNTPELRKQAYVFRAHFSDNTRVALVIDAAFGTEEAARTEAMRYVHPLGKLPTTLRHGIKRGLVVHKGGEDTTAFSDRGLIIVYSDNATKRIGTHDLEETIFHESIHASWDRAHARSEGWTAAQAKDGAFLTEYAQKKPKNEDLAESALFAYTLLHHPERIPADDAKRIREMVPNRIAYIAQLLPPGEPIFTTLPRPAPARQSEGDGSQSDECLIDIDLRGQLADILSNALRSDFSNNTRDAASELLADDSYDNGEALFQAVVARLNIDPENLKASILRHYHVNCTHGPVDNSAAEQTLALWKPAPIGEKERERPAQPLALDQTAQASAQHAQMISVVSELRWTSRLLILVLVSNAVMIALLVRSRSAKSREAKPLR
jgi:hypothetical protein